MDVDGSPVLPVSPLDTISCMIEPDEDRLMEADLYNSEDLDVFIGSPVNDESGPPVPHPRTRLRA